MIFYSHWRSLAAYRVRIALALKGIPHELAVIDMFGGEQHGDAFKAINPQGLLPALATDDGQVLFQSLPIIEYLEDLYPTPALLPADPAGRARVRALALIHAADSHPLLVPHVRQYLQKEAGFDDATLLRWLHRNLLVGARAYEGHLAASPHTGTFCHGETPTLADICLGSHLLAMRFFNCDDAAFPVCRRVFAACEALDVFANAHPFKQPGAPVQA